MMLRVLTTGLSSPHLLGSLPFLGFIASKGVSPLRARATWCMGETTSNIFSPVDFLDEALYHFLELVAVFRMVALELMKLTPQVGFRPYDVWLGRWHMINIVRVEDLAKYLLMTSVQLHEVMYRTPALFEGHYVSNRRGIVAYAPLLRVIKTANCLLINI